MSHSRFEYGEELLSSCAHSKLAAYVTTISNQKQYDISDEDSLLQEPAFLVMGDLDETLGSDVSCTILHQRHATHYGLSTPRAYTKSHPGNTVDSNNDVYVIDGRLQRFLLSVLYTHRHNSQPKNLHRVSLNQFSDQDPQTLIVALSRNLAPHDANPWDDAAMEMLPLATKDWMFDPLEKYTTATKSHSIIDIAANLTVGHGGMGHLDVRRRKKEDKRIQDAIAEKVKFPSRLSDPNFALPDVDDDGDGDLLNVKPRLKIEKYLRAGSFEKRDQFGRHLNWATGDNPDGVPIVKDAIDQVSKIHTARACCKACKGNG